MEKERGDLLKELLVEFARYAFPLGASCLKLLGRDSDVLHITAQHKVHLRAIFLRRTISCKHNSEGNILQNGI